jgi:hypothetical protein
VPWALACEARLLQGLTRADILRLDALLRRLQERAAGAPH